MSEWVEVASLRQTGLLSMVLDTTTIEIAKFLRCPACVQSLRCGWFELVSEAWDAYATRVSDVLVQLLGNPASHLIIAGHLFTLKHVSGCYIRQPLSIDL
jgi:hypothetical protein